MIPQYLVFDNDDEIWHQLGTKWKEISVNAIREKGRFTVALSGGKTPAGFYHYLSKTRGLPWERTHLFLVDERFVPWDSPESNYRMLQENLPGTLQIPSNNIHPISTAESPDVSAKKYEEEMRQFFVLTENSIPEFDLILLGIGEDGHTASLFPGTEALKETKRLVVPVRPGAALMDRISLTLPLINNASNVFFLVTGQRKKAVMKRIRGGHDTAFPASMVNPKRGRLFFLMDREAAE
jgi:6-phosphogluconolactonase